MRESQNWASQQAQQAQPQQGFVDGGRGDGGAYLTSLAMQALPSGAGGGPAARTASYAPGMASTAPVQRSSRDAAPLQQQSQQQQQFAGRQGGRTSSVGEGTVASFNQMLPQQQQQAGYGQASYGPRGSQGQPQAQLPSQPPSLLDAFSERPFLQQQQQSRQQQQVLPGLDVSASTASLRGPLPSETPRVLQRTQAPSAAGGYRGQQQAQGLAGEGGSGGGSERPLESGAPTPTGRSDTPLLGSVIAEAQRARCEEAVAACPLPCPIVVRYAC